MLATAVVAMLQRLYHHHVLEQRASKRMRGDLFHMLDADEMAGEAHIVKIELRRLDQPLANIGVERRQPESDIARLQHLDPIAGGGVADAGVGAKRHRVRQLSDASGAQADESLKARQIANLTQAAHVAFDVGLEVVAQGLPRLEPLVVDSRIESRVQNLIHPIVGAASLSFCKREGQQA